jgi:multidrug resistance protein
MGDQVRDGKEAEIGELRPASSSTNGENRQYPRSVAIEKPSLIGEADSRHPYRWSKTKRWTHVVIFSIIESVTPLASMMFAPVVLQVSQDIANDQITRTTLAVSIYVLGFIVGPLIFGPLSELYGRISIYRITVAVYLCMSIGCALSTSITMLTAFRFLAGCFGAAPMVIGGAAVADMFPKERRGRPMAIYSTGPFLGLTIGPVFGGLINFYSNWRWIFWALSIAAAVLSFCTFAVLRETHLPTISRRVEDPVFRRLVRGFRKHEIRRRGPTNHMQHLLDVLLPAFFSPVRITFSSLPLFCLFTCNALFTGVMNTLFYTLGSTYQSHAHYSFNTLNTGLSYLGISIGGVLASIILSKTSDKLVVLLIDRLGQAIYAERYRLPPLILGVLLSFVGLVWYGWAVHGHTFWLIPILGTFIFGLGMLSVQAAFPTYLLHAYSEKAGVILSASIVTRSIGGSTLPLAGPIMNAKLGYGWTGLLLGTVDLLFLLPSLSLFIVPALGRRNKDQENRSIPFSTEGKIEDIESSGRREKR